MSKVQDIIPAAYNPRKISKVQLEALGRSLREFGDLGGLVVNTKTGKVVGGHQRLKHLDPRWKITKAAATDTTGTTARGYVNTPFGCLDYREVSWPEIKEKAANIAANAHGGDFDNAALTELLKDLQAAGQDLSLTGLDSGLIDSLLESIAGVEDDSENVMDPPKEPNTKPGELWKLGAHRLLCGDSTSARNVEKLMAGEKASLMWTDPPYGVEYVGKTRKALVIQNDGAEGLPQLLSEAFLAADTEALADGAAIYIAHPPGALSLVFGDAVRAVEWRLHETLVWVKDSMVLGHSDYHYRHEPIYLCYKGGEGRAGRGGAGWYGSNKETSVLEFARPKRSEEHPTMKPIDLVAYCVGNSSPRGGAVFDPFLGSGTTLVACEKMGRRCYGIELSPAFCDVIIARWEKATGKKAVRC